MCGGVVDILILQPVEPAAIDPVNGGSLAQASSKGAHLWRVLTLRRAVNVRCTGAWEIVHGRIETGELPADAAVREVQEETGLTVDRLYSLTVNPFYLHQTNTVQLAIGQLMGSLGVINWGGIMACGVIVTIPVVILRKRSDLWRFWI